MVPLPIVSFDLFCSSCNWHISTRRRCVSLCVCVCTREMSCSTGCPPRFSIVCLFSQFPRSISFRQFVFVNVMPQWMVHMPHEFIPSCDHPAQYTLVSMPFSYYCRLEGSCGVFWLVRAHITKNCLLSSTCPLEWIRFPKFPVFVSLSSGAGLYKLRTGSRPSRLHLNLIHRRQPQPNTTGVSLCVWADGAVKPRWWEVKGCPYWNELKFTNCVARSSPGWRWMLYVFSTLDIYKE